MATSNINVARSWVNGHAAKTRNLKSSGDLLLSFGHIIARRMSDGAILVQSRRKPSHVLTATSAHILDVASVAQGVKPYSYCHAPMESFEVNFELFRKEREIYAENARIARFPHTYNTALVDLNWVFVNVAKFAELVHTPLPADFKDVSSWVLTQLTEKQVLKVLTWRMVA